MSNISFAYGENFNLKNVSVVPGKIYLDRVTHELWYDDPTGENADTHFKINADNVDTTLQISGYSADAKVTGDAIASINNEIDRLDSASKYFATTDYVDEKIASIDNVGDGGLDHTHNNLELLHTISGTESISVDAAVVESSLDIKLSSEVYTDFSNISVVMTYDETSVEIQANADGTLPAQAAQSEFTLTLQSTDEIFDASQVTIECTYLIDVGKTLRDYVLAVDVNGDGTDGGDSNISSIPVEVDETLSISGMAADAKVTGDAIASIENDISNIDSAIDNLNSEKVPITRTINGKSLNNNIVLTAEDIGVVTETVEVDTTLTVSGSAADAKTTGDAITNLNTLVGNTPVADQIAEAIVEVYVQNEEPTDAPSGSIWVDTDEEGLSGTPKNDAANVYVVDAATTDITTVDFSKYVVGDVVLVTTS